MHAVAAAASSLQVLVVVVASATVKTALVEVLVVDEPLAGAVIVTTGRTESTVKFTVADPLPAALVAVTVTEWHLVPDRCMPAGSCSWLLPLRRACR